MTTMDNQQKQGYDHDLKKPLLADVTLFQRISLDREALCAFENMVYSIHLISERQDDYALKYINRVTNYLSQIILLQSAELGSLRPFREAEKYDYENEYHKYIKPFELAIAQLKDKETI